MIKTVIVLLVAFLAHVNCQCTFSGAYSEAAKYAINFDPLYPACREYHFGGFNVRKAITLAFSNVAIDCRIANIIVTNEYRQPIFNFCQNQMYNLKCDSYFVIVNLIINAPFGNIVTDMGFSMGDPSSGPVNPPSTTTTTQAPPPTTVQSTTKTTTLAPPPPPTTTGSTISLKCGLPTYKPSDSEMRIIGGNEAVPNSWPWQTFITDGVTMCGASLINEQWLLTAAHCITGRSMKAYLGAHDLSKTYSSAGIAVSKIIPHPDYNTDTLKNDIALLKLEKPVQFNDKIQPVCLPTKLNAQPGRVGMVTGWGKIGDYAGTASKLQQAAVPVKSNTECAFFGLSSTQFCAGNTNAGSIRDSCQGDSGGPLVTKEGSNFVLAGIVSYGGPSCNGYGVYTNVYSYMDWIQKTISAY